MDIATAAAVLVLSVPAIMVSAFYYTDSENHLPRRFFVSAHGLLFVCAIVIPMLVPSTLRRFIGTCLFIVACVSVVYSLTKFRGEKVIHIAQLVNFPYAVFLLFVLGYD
jgi:hypothetical protein